MHEHSFTVIEGGNPDDQFSKTGTPQLQLIQPDRRVTTTHSFTHDRPVLIRMIDWTIGRLMALRAYLESRGPRRVTDETDNTPYYGRGW